MTISEWQCQVKDSVGCNMGSAQYIPHYIGAKNGPYV